MGRFIVFLLVVVAIAGAAVFAVFRQDISTANARLTGRGVVVDTSFGKIEYAEAGEGLPVFGIHGTGGGFDQGLDMAAPLTDSYRLIAPSRFGYLGSDFPDGATLEMQADAFDELLDRLGIDQAFIFGGSAGALSAMQLAIRHPERCRALVLVVPAAYAPGPGGDAAVDVGPVVEAAMRTVLGSDFIFWSAMKVFPKGMTRMLLATKPEVVDAAAPMEQKRVADILQHILPVSIRAEGLMFDMQTAGAPKPMDLGRIACPVLTVSLEDDLFGTAVPARFIAEGVPDGRAVIYPSGGHVWVGHHEELWKEVADFLDTQIPPPTNAATAAQ